MALANNSKIEVKYNTLSDGNHTEGIGALLQYQLFCYAFCKLNNFDFEFPGFKNLQHFQYTDQSQEEFSQAVTKFCGLPVKEVSKDSIFKSPKDIMDYGQQNINNVVPILKQLNTCKIEQTYYDSSFVNVAVHIRTFTKTDCDPSPLRECFNHQEKKIISNYYKNVSDKLNKIYDSKKLKYHVYSQSSLSDLEIFNSIFPNIEYHIDEHPIITLDHMINANVLVMANSSLSYVAHLYGKNKCIAKPTFYHSLYMPNIIQ